MVLLLVGCKNGERTIEEVLEDEIAYDINEIIYKEEVSDEILMVLYTCGGVFENENNNMDYLNVAFFRKDQERGWNFIGDKDWSKVNNNLMEVYEDTIHYIEGNDMKDISVIYGKVIDKQIEKVEVGNDETQYVDADIVEKKGKQYFYHIYHLNWEDIDDNETSNTSSFSDTTSVGAYGMRVKGIAEDGQVLIYTGGN